MNVAASEIPLISEFAKERLGAIIADNQKHIFTYERARDVVRKFFPDEYDKLLKQKEKLEPQRGSIIDHNGKLLAMSTPMYNVYMDCYVLKEENERADAKARENAKEGEEVESKEDNWIRKAEALAKRLPEVLQDEGKSASYYSELISSGRRNKRRYVSIVKNIDHGTLQQLKELGQVLL